jgi:zinc transporter ZupT
MKFLEAKPMQWLVQRAPALAASAPALLATRGAPGLGREDENHWVSAFLYGVVSAASLPIGAVLGVLLSPVEPLVVANIIAFGAGCLLFAVTVELYGEQLMHLEAKNHHQEGLEEMAICLGAAVVGSCLYIALNRWVEGMEGGGEPAAAPKPEAAPEKPPTEKTALAKQLAKASPRLGMGIVAKLKRKSTSKMRLKYGIPAHAEDKAASSLALGMLAGIMADGIPESILIGFLASKGSISTMFIVSLFIANFPESFSSASLMREHQTFSTMAILGLWALPCLMTGSLAAIACYFVPVEAHELTIVQILAATIEGLAGGMMLAMIASVMLPQAFNMAKEEKQKGTKDELPSWAHGGDVPGVFCVCGFLLAVGLKVYGGAQEAVAGGGHGHFF